MSLFCALRGPLRVIHSTFKSISICVLAGTVFVAGLTGIALTARADGAEESPHGALFRRKGWIMPAIYQKARKEEEQGKAQQKPKVARKAPTKTGQRKKITARKAVGGKHTSKLRSAARARLPDSEQSERAAETRIPIPVVNRGERNLQVSSKRKTKSQAYAVKVASLGVDLLSVPKSVAPILGLRTHKESVTGGGGRVNWVASSRCLPSRLRAAINHVARNYGRVRVNSTCRSRKHNRRVGGASRSWHLQGRAADIRVFGNIGKAARYLRRVVGGFKHYGGGLFHIDTGPRRSW